jgi:flagellar protein FlgJ
MNIPGRLDLSVKTDQISRDHAKLKADLEKSNSDLAKVSQEFESIFLEIVLKSMREATMKGGLVDGGNGEEVFRSMLDAEYAKEIAAQGGTGLAKAIEEQLRTISGETQKARGQETYKAEKL